MHIFSTQCSDGPLEVKLKIEIWKSCIFKFLMPFRAGRLLSAENAFKNFPEP